MSKETTTVKILGASYKIACPADNKEAALLGKITLLAEGGWKTKPTWVLLIKSNHWESLSELPRVTLQHVERDVRESISCEIVLSKRDLLAPEVKKEKFKWGWSWQCVENQEVKVVKSCIRPIVPQYEMYKDSVKLDRSRPENGEELAGTGIKVDSGGSG